MFKNHEINLHTHTELCKHAKGSVEEFCQTALEHGFKVLGFSDHAPFPDDRPLPDRMTLAEMTIYNEWLERAEKYSPELIVLRGFELDYQPDMQPYQEFRKKLRLDYMLGSAHRVQAHGREVFFCERDSVFDEEIMVAFAEAVLVMLRSGVVEAIAHPDAGAARYSGAATPEMKRLFREIGREARLRNIPLELNVNGTFGKGLEPDRWRYPWAPFWEEAAKENPPVIIGIDAHVPKMFTVENIQKVYDFASKMNLNIINAAFAEMLIKRKKHHG